MNSTRNSRKQRKEKKREGKDNKKKGNNNKKEGNNNKKKGKGKSNLKRKGQSKRCPNICNCSTRN